MSRFSAIRMVGVGFSVSLITLGLMAPVESTAQKKANQKGSAQKSQSAIQTSKATQPNFDSDVKAVIEKYCVSCLPVMPGLPGHPWPARHVPLT